jgi:rubrerythrin
MLFIVNGAAAPDWAFTMWIVTVVVVGAFSFAVWRCPHCGTSLGRRLSPDVCPQCYVQLTPKDRVGAA